MAVRRRRIPSPVGENRIDCMRWNVASMPFNKHCRSFRLLPSETIPSRMGRLVHFALGQMHEGPECPVPVPWGRTIDGGAAGRVVNAERTMPVNARIQGGVLSAAGTNPSAWGVVRMAIGWWTAA